MVNEAIVKKRLDFCLGVEAWSTGFEVAECETEWLDTPPHGKKKRVTLFSNSNHALIIGVFESIPAYLSSKASKALLCSSTLHLSAAISNCFP